MLPEVKEIGTLNCSDEELSHFTEVVDLNPGDLVYCKDEDAIAQYMVVEWERDPTVIMDDYKTLLPTLFENNDEISPSVFVEEYLKFKDKT